MSDKEQLVNQLADLIAPHVKRRGDLPDLLDLVKREIWRREDAIEAAERRASLDAFKAENSVLPWPEFAVKYGLHDKEYRIASHTLSQQRFESGISFFVDTEPTPEQRRYIGDETTMSARQAAEYLGISRGKFNKLKKQHKLEHVGVWRAGQTSGGFPAAAYLYRLSDIRALKDA